LLYLYLYCSLFCKVLLVYIHLLFKVYYRCFDSRTSGILSSFTVWIYNREKTRDVRHSVHWMIVKTLIDNKYWSNIILYTIAAYRGCLVNESGSLRRGSTSGYYREPPERHKFHSILNETLKSRTTTVARFTGEVMWELEPHCRFNPSTI